MGIRKSRIERKKTSLKILILCILVFGLGYFILNHISRLEDPFLGNTFHILLGCILMAVSGLFFIITFKQQFFPKKRKRTNHVFLEDQQKKSKS